MSQRDLKGASQNLRARKWAKKPGESLNNWYGLIFKPEHVSSCCHLIVISRRRHHSFVAAAVYIGGDIHPPILGKALSCGRDLKVVLIQKLWQVLRSALLSWQWPPATLIPPLVKLQAIWPLPSARWNFTSLDSHTFTCWCSLWRLFPMARILKVCLVVSTRADVHLYCVGIWADTWS